MVRFVVIKILDLILTDDVALIRDVNVVDHFFTNESTIKINTESSLPPFSSPNWIAVLLNWDWNA